MPIHLHEVEFVPRFGDLPFLDAHEGDSRKLHWIVRGCKAEMITCVPAAHVATSNGPVAFRDHVFESDVHIRKRAAKLPVKLPKSMGTLHGLSSGVDQPVDHNIVGHQLADNFRPTLIPDLIEPATDSGLISF